MKSFTEDGYGEKKNTGDEIDWCSENFENFAEKYPNYLESSRGI